MLTWKEDGVRSTFDVPRDIYIQTPTVSAKYRSFNVPRDNIGDPVIVIKNGAISRRRGQSRSSSELYSTYGNDL